MEIATKEFLNEIETLSLNRKKEIRNSKSEYIAQGRIFYISENGNDSSDGLSPENSFGTVEKIAQIDLIEGDTILLERGSVFRGHLTLNTPGITVSAYGIGKKPIINGSPENGAKPHYWALCNGTTDIYKYYKELPDVGGICFNEGAVAAIKCTPNFVNGKFINSEKEQFDVAKDLTEDYMFFCDVRNELYNGVPAVHDPEKHKGALYLKCQKGNPGEVFSSIEFISRGNTVRPGADNITIDNLCLLYCGTHSIGTGTRNGLTVKNTEIGWGGGCIQFYTQTGYPVRFGNGIEIYGSCKDFTVENCYIYQIYDAGITHQYQFGTADSPACVHENVIYRNNLVEYCIYNIEYFLGQVGHDDQIMRNILMENNILRFAGYGWGSFHARAAHIKGWDHRNISKNFIIRNNIFDRSRSMVIHCGVQDEIHLPIVDGNTYIHSNSGKMNLGRFSKRNSTEFCYPPERLEYNEDNIINTVKDKKARIYFTEEQPDISGFWPSGMIY